jgi:hypothetical protein
MRTLGFLTMGAVVAAGVMIVIGLPDIKRYIEMKRM